MMKGTLVDDNMSNLTSASNNQTLQPTTKKKRNLPGNPDPEAEVIALSPRALLATNRFICEVCNKGFQRDQNLQLHRRGHNLPWKLKQRANKEVIRKKVYVCPEAGCVHHEASRALGDLTGIKKHFSRKHGEKKWKCDKCSKRYAVQSDWKAHSKICGTREYRCDCGTLFSRRDSFITHRAFCDALADESAKTTPISISSSQPPPNSTILSHFNFHTHPFQQFPLKTEQHEDHIPPWLGHLSPNPNPNPNSPFQQPPPHMSATALLQKAAQMGVKMSKDGPPKAMFSRPHQVQPYHMCTTGLGLSSHEDMGNGGFVHGLSSFGDKGAVNVTSGCMDQVGATVETMMVSSLSSSNGYDHASIATFEEAFNGVLNSRGGERNFEERLPPSLSAVDQACLNRSKEGGGGCSSGGNDGLTRDFLGLRGLPHGDFVSMGGLENMSSTSSYHHRNNQNQTPWQG